MFCDEGPVFIEPSDPLALINDVAEVRDEADDGKGDERQGRRPEVEMVDLLEDDGVGLEELAEAEQQRLANRRWPTSKTRRKEEALADKQDVEGNGG